MANVKKAYIALTHRYAPSRQQRGKWEVTEECKFVSSLKDKVLRESSVIVDVIKEEVVKCWADGGDYQSLIKYVSEKYALEYNQFCKVAGIEPYVAPVEEKSETEAVEDAVEVVAEVVEATAEETKSE